MLFGRMAKPGMFEFFMAPKETFLACSTQLYLETSRAPLWDDKYMELRENLYYKLWVLFIYLFVCLFNNMFSFLFLQCLIFVD